MTKSKQANHTPTIQTVADLAGVSATTVSFVINSKSGGNVRISDATRSKVWQIVAELNYRPSAAARSLRTRRSNLLALMIPYIESPFNHLIAAVVQREAESMGLDLVIYGSRDDYEREREFLDALPSRGVDGAIIASHQMSSSDIARLLEVGIAVVVLGSSPTHSFADKVMIDEVKAAEEAVNYLIDQGHKRIGAIVGPEPTWAGRLRKDGYCNALWAHNIAVEDELIREMDFFRPGAGTLAMQELLALPDPPTAVFAGMDRFAVDALLGAVDCGHSVPEDVAVIGYDFGPRSEATRVRPRLTTIRKDADLLGAAAVQLLVERISSDETLSSRERIVDHRIIYRESV